MSWRKFRVMMRCLSPQSATVSRLNSERSIGGDRAHLVATPEAAEAAFQAAFANRGRSKSSVG